MSPLDTVFERELWTRGKTPAGLDEAGRGPLAGPVVAAAVILPVDFINNGINDSKKLTPRKRELICEEIKRSALAVGIGVVEPMDIDRLNILKASLLAMEKAVYKLTRKPDYLLIDGNQRTSLLIPQETLVKGDSRCCSIAAASIVAKVTRDSIMDEYHEMYPEYNFIKHKGYPTREHLEIIKKIGPCPIHRKTFRGVL